MNLGIGRHHVPFGALDDRKTAEGHRRHPDFELRRSDRHGQEFSPQTNTQDPITDERIFLRLALIAGGLVAIAEQVFQELYRSDRSLGQSLPLNLMAMPPCIKYGSDSVEALAWYRFGIRLRRPAKLLYEAFPPPPLEDDELLQSWVRNQRRLWLNGSIGDSIEVLQNNPEMIETIRQFIVRG